MSMPLANDEKRRYLILTSGEFLLNGKTAHGVIRYAPESVAAVVDSELAGKRLTDVAPWLKRDVPFVGSVQEGLRLRPTSLLIGSAPMGGRLPSAWRSEVISAIRAGLDVVSGLHELLEQDAEFVAEAQRYGVALVDVRKPPDVPIFSGRVYDVSHPTLLTVGNDCAVGKMTVSLEIVAAARSHGVDACFVPTGQTGIMIAGWGIAVDRVIADFTAGAAETLVVKAAERCRDLIVVEGQGAINHPAYAAVTTAILFGSAPDALLLVYNPSLTTIDLFDTPTLPYGELIAMYEGLCRTVKPARVVGVALNTGSFSESDARREIERATRETGLPADDVVRHGAATLYRAIAPAITRQPHRGFAPLPQR